MAQIEGALATIDQIDELNLIKGIPVEPLVSPYILDQSPIGSTQIITGRFPTPPSAAGFLTMVVDENGEDPIRISRIFGNPLIGAVFPEGKYLEPTIGQIWPR